MNPLAYLLVVSSYLLALSLPAQTAGKGALRDSSIVVTNEVDATALAALAAATNGIDALIAGEGVSRAQADAALAAATAAATNALAAALGPRITAATNLIAVSHANLLADLQGADAATRLYLYAALTNGVTDLGVVWHAYNTESRAASEATNAATRQIALAAALAATNAAASAASAAAALARSEDELHTDSATNVVWRTVWSNGWCWLVAHTNTP